jgi:hypothetical protein
VVDTGGKEMTKKTKRNKDYPKPNEGDLRVWWTPQVPMKAFYVSVKTVREGRLILDTLAFYEIFQFDNKVKPDYCNTGGLEVFENGEWTDWYDEMSGDGIDELDDFRKIHYGLDDPPAGLIQPE